MREINVEKIEFETADGARFKDRGGADKHEEALIEAYLDTTTGHELARIVYHFAPRPALTGVSVYTQVRMAVAEAIESERNAA